MSTEPKKTRLAYACGALLMIAEDHAGSEDQMPEMSAQMQEVLMPYSQDPGALMWCAMYLAMIAANTIKLGVDGVSVAQVAQTIHERADQW